MSTQTANGQFTNFANSIEKSQIFSKEMPISNLGVEQVGEDSYISLVDSSKGAQKLFRTTPEAVKAIASMIGVDTNLISKLENSMGKEATNKLLFLIKNALKQNDKMVRVVINFQTKTVIDVQEKPMPFLSTENFLNIVESKLTDGTEILNAGVDGNGTAQITIKSDKWGFKLAGKRNEEFHIGMMLSNGITTGTFIAPYFFRLVCKNGMVREGKSDQFTLALKGTKEDYIREFITGVEALNFNSFDPSKFHERVTYMENTRASFAELAKLRKASEGVLNYKGQDEKATANMLLEEYFPTADIKGLYAKKGITFEDLTHNHHKNIKTKLTCWDLLNNLTDFASHDYGVEIEQANRIYLQKEAGKYMERKAYDTEYLVPQVYQ